MTADARTTAAAGIVGASAARSGMAADAIDGLVPDVVVTPPTPEHVAAILVWANAERLSLVVAGGRTKDAWGRPPRPIDVLVSLAALSRVIAHEAGDLTATVEAGASLGAINGALAPSRQWLPLDPPFASRATIGGLIATNDSGPRRHRFGTPRDLILGVTLATADGVLASAGGRVVKNVAGYDLGKLVCGSHGQLAVVVGATFKLVPMARSSTTVVAKGGVTALTRLISSLTERQLEPTSVSLELEGHDSRLLVRFESVPSAIEAAVAEIITLAREADSEATVVGDADEAALWRRHTERPWQTGAAVVRASWLPADLPRVVEAVQTLATTIPVEFAAEVGVGSGLLGLGGDVDQQVLAIAAIRAWPFVGNVVVRAGARTLRERVEVWGAENASRRLGSAIKRAWDPHGVLGAGRGPL